MNYCLNQQSIQSTKAQKSSVIISHAVVPLWMSKWHSPNLLIFPNEVREREGIGFNILPIVFKEIKHIHWHVHQSCSSPKGKDNEECPAPLVSSMLQQLTFQMFPGHTRLYNRSCGLSTSAALLLALREMPQRAGRAAHCSCTR